MMMAFGFLFMLAVLALPVLLIVGLVVWMMRTNQQATPPPPAARPQVTIPPQRGAPPAPVSPSAARACSHCGAGLQPDWTHCPQCGAPVG